MNAFDLDMRGFGMLNIDRSNGLIFLRVMSKYKDLE